MPIYNPGLFAGSPEMVLFDYFLGVGMTLFVPVLVMCIAMILTQRS